jgi:hypothetical protein
MNDPDQDRQLDALFAQARSRRPDTSAAEFAFETRLLARLRAREETASTQGLWAMVSWRLLPIFATCVVALTLWHSEIVTETSDAEQMAYVDNPEPLDSWNTLN